jgi:hypothetical protein
VKSIEIRKHAPGACSLGSCQTSLPTTYLPLLDGFLLLAVYHLVALNLPGNSCLHSLPLSVLIVVGGNSSCSFFAPDLSRGLGAGVGRCGGCAGMLETLLRVGSTVELLVPNLEGNLD